MSFRYKFIFAFVILEIFFIFLIVGLNLITIEERNKNYIKDKISSTNILLTELIKAPLSVYDIATLDNIVSSTSDIEDLKYIYIVDSNHKTLSTNIKLSQRDKFKHYEEKDIIKVIDNKTFNFVKKEIFNDGYVIGHLHLIYDLTNTYSAIEKNKKRTYFLIFLEIIISTLIAFFIGRSLTNSLLKLTESAEQIAKGVKIEIPFLFKKDEIGILANTMNQMQNDIFVRNEKLKLYERMFSSTKEGIIITDKNGVIIDCNSAYINITGYERDELIGSKANKIKSEKHNKDFFQKLWESVVTSGSWRGEIINKRKDGSIFYSLLNISSIEDENGKNQYYIGIIADTTELKENEKIIQMQSKMAMLGEMLENIAHQWRQPLSVITTSASGILVQKDMDLLSDESLEKALNNIVTTSNYLSHTIDDFRNFFSQNKECTSFELEHTFSNALKIISTVLNEKNIEVISSIENTEIESYENELIQVILNILNNSKDALCEKDYKRYIFIDVKDLDNKVSINIKDNGMGVNENIIDRIFEPYFTTKHKSQGTGIGLYMVHNIIVGNLKGNINVLNEEFAYKDKNYKGLKFMITLPKSIKE